ncbi:MAG: DUF4965 domain-containing protein [Clostridia bacterium]|nr:DUF4965 domain-containing protein [Clostridia bacterium]
MKMRMPCVPLITVDPYFSVWSEAENLTAKKPIHWTAKPNTMLGTVCVDGEVWRFLGKSDAPAMEQVSLDADAMTTTAVFEAAGIRLTAKFTSPMLVEELYYASRPVTYLKLSWESVDGGAHTVAAKMSCSEELVLNLAGEGRACSREEKLPGLSCVRMGSGAQKVLWRSGDDVRIDWGYFYLAVRGEAEVGNEVIDDLYAVYAETELKNEALFLFAYDDIDSMIYFEKPLKAYWKKDGKTIQEAICEAAAEYDALYAKCTAFSEKLRAEATEKGGKKYAEMLLLAYRQIMAAHKLIVDEEGNNLFISKECFSNGCAATVDITYPSAPMFLRYNTELLKGMIRPVMRYSRTPEWVFDFAPHDVGRYPILNGQVYGKNALKYQMPVEECGNIIILVAAMCKIDNDYSFAVENMDLLETWNNYLVQYGADPADQLCTDDFAGHLAHNCNLSFKAIMGMVGFADILSHLGRADEAAALVEKAKEYIAFVLENAKNEDGSYRLAYDRPGSFSLKYNAVWDKLWQTNLIPEEFFKAEIKRYKEEALPYGVPLDTREKYTKSDWELWVACMADTREDFEFFTGLLWNAYNTMRTRVPMTDWYFADTSEMRGFRHRAVQGGLFMKLLFD